MMNRRGFFGLIAAGVAAAADPERLLWTPGKKLISIPKPVLTPVMTLRATVFFFDNLGQMWMKTDQGTVKLIRQIRQIEMDADSVRYLDNWIVPNDPVFSQVEEPTDPIYKWVPTSMPHIEPGDKLITTKPISPYLDYEKVQLRRW